MLRRRLASFEYLLNPFVRNPLAEEVGHAAHKDGAGLLPALRLIQFVAMEGGIKRKWIGRFLPL